MGSSYYTVKHTVEKLINTYSEKVKYSFYSGWSNTSVLVQAIFSGTLFISASKERQENCSS